jgi:hypothetical protein
MYYRRMKKHIAIVKDVDSALDVLSADELRKTVRNVLDELDEQARGRVASALINHAARSKSGWTPALVAEREVAETISFAKAAQRVAHADPSAVEEHLRRGTRAFLRKDYASAHRILGALLVPIGKCEIDLGQEELVEEVLSPDTMECTAQYLVCAYMIARPAERAEAVLAAINEVRCISHFYQPIADMERAAVEPLGDIDSFLPRWRDLIEPRRVGHVSGPWDMEEDAWRREVVTRLEGAAGLAKLARTTRTRDDLRAWCQGLVQSGDWKAALAAFEESAELATDDWMRGDMLDGAALAAEKLCYDDVPDRRERAWHARPSMVRLCAWLGLASTPSALSKWVTRAFDACPAGDFRQQSFLELLQGRFEAAATLLATASGLGWSDEEHPGRLLFPLFARLLAPSNAFAQSNNWLAVVDTDPSRLPMSDIEQILGKVGVDGVGNPSLRRVVLAAMRKAAESRAAGVTGRKRRGHYEHAAQLIAACVLCDRSTDTAGWLAGLRAQYRRFPALRSELDRALRPE